MIAAPSVLLPRCAALPVAWTKRDEGKMRSKIFFFEPNPLPRAKRPRGGMTSQSHGERDETDPDQVQDHAGAGGQECRADCGGVRRIEGLAARRYALSFAAAGRRHVRPFGGDHRR